MFNQSIKNSFTLSFDFWYTDRNVIDTGMEYQIDIESARNVNSLKYSLVTLQTAARIGVPNKRQFCINLMLQSFLSKLLEFDILRILLV